MSVGPTLVLLGVGNLIWGWATGTFLVPTLRRASDRAQRGDERTDRWARAMHALDRFGVRFFSVNARLCIVCGLGVAVAGLVLVSVGR